MSQLKRDLTGERFGYLVVVSRAPNRPPPSGVVMWNCECDCGKKKVIQGSSLKSGNTTSCGCHRFTTITKHMLTGTPEYRSWAAALQRCTNSNNPDFHHYGGRGIEVCQEWASSFETFYEEMGERPEGTSLDRVDPNGNYCKENCRWVDQSVQCYNRRKSSNNRSGRTGVSWNERDKLWAATWVEDKKRKIKHFKTFEEALICREEAELRLYGELKEIWSK